MSDEEVRRLERMAREDPSYGLRARRAAERHAGQKGRAARARAAWREMSDLEERGVAAFAAAKIPTGKAKRIRDSLGAQRYERRITDAQAAALWTYLWVYRRVVLERSPEALETVRLAGLRALALGRTTRKAFAKTCGQFVARAEVSLWRT